MGEFYNTVELTKRWCELTGTPEKEARHRVLTMRRAGMLPDARIARTKPLSDYDVALFVIGAMCADEHIHVVDAIHNWADLVPEIGIAPFHDQCLIATLSTLMSLSHDRLYPLRILHIIFSQTQRRVELELLDTRTNECFTIYYGNMHGDPPAIERSITLSGAVILGMAP